MGADRFAVQNNMFFLSTRAVCPLMPNLMTLSALCLLHTYQLLSEHVFCLRGYCITMLMCKANFFYLRSEVCEDCCVLSSPVSKKQPSAVKPKVVLCLLFFVMLCKRFLFPFCRAALRTHMSCYHSLIPRGFIFDPYFFVYGFLMGDGVMMDDADYS